MSRSFVSQKIKDIPPSGIRRFFDIASAIPDAISLGVGEPDFVTPYHIRSAAVESIVDGGTQYTANKGLLRLRQEIAKYLENRFGLSYVPENEILVTVGASEAIDLALRATIEPGDEVVIPDPGYVSYSPCVIFAGGVPVLLPSRAETNFIMEAEALEKCITPRTKAVIFPYPNNPTGAIMRCEDLQKIADVCIRHDLLVISDEIYCELTYGDTHSSIAALPGMKERTIYISGFSKAFAMTGWRLGYTCAPKDILSEMNKIHQYAIMCAPRQSQEAGIEALKQGRSDQYKDVEFMRDSYDRRRRVMLDAFSKMNLPCFEPKGAFYCFPSIRETGLDSETFCKRLLEEEKVVCVPGTAFGESGEGHIRCCYATDLKKMLEAFERMNRFLDKIK